MESVTLPVPRATRPLRARLLRLGVLSVIFVAGSVAGYCVGTMQLLQLETGAADVVAKPNKFTEFLLAHLKKDLNLTEQQYPSVERIVLRHHAEFEKIRNDWQAAFGKEMAKMDVEMFAVLDPAQSERWKTRMERMRHWHRSSQGGSSRRDKGGSKPDGTRKPEDRKPREPKPDSSPEQKPTTGEPGDQQPLAKPSEAQ